MHYSTILRTLTLFVLGAVSFSELARAGEATVSSEPKVIPATRPEIKSALDALKKREARLPLPAPDAAGGVNNGRMRSKYLPATWHSANRSSTSRDRTRDGASQDPNYAFKTACFWIVSRGNNCHYCLGHQELKLRSAGLDDDTVASLDVDWSQFDPRWQAALAYARALTLESHNIAAFDFSALHANFTNDEILELTFDIARFNATNRWTDGMGIPQDDHFREESSNFLTPTSSKYQQTASIAAPTTRSQRPAALTFDDVLKQVIAAHKRSGRIDFARDSPRAVALTKSIGDREPREWELAMAAAGDSGAAQVTTWNTIVGDDNLTPQLKAELWLITSVENHAWYSTAQAIDRLTSLGVSSKDQSAALELAATADPDGAAQQLARKLTSDPHLITDEDIYRVRTKYGDAPTAQIVHVICMANLFTRFTEGLQLPIEQEIMAKLDGSADQSVSNSQPTTDAVTTSNRTR